MKSSFHQALYWCFMLAIIIALPIFFPIYSAIHHQPYWAYFLGLVPMLLLLLVIPAQRIMIYMGIKIKWFADFCCWIGWHWETTKDDFDGASLHGECLHCHKHGMYDSNGNFF